MTRRSPLMVLLLSLITLGIYTIWWDVVTKDEMNAKGAQIPTALLLIIPFANLYWGWKFSQGVELVTNKKMSAVAAFLLVWLLGVIGMAIIQDALNKVAT